MDEEEYLITKKEIEGYRIVARMLIIVGGVLLTIGLVFHLIFHLIFLIGLSILMIILGLLLKLKVWDLGIKLEVYEERKKRKKATAEAIFKE